MSENSYPVTVAVRRADGSVEQVRVGTANKTSTGFSIRLDELSIGESAGPSERAVRGTSSGGAVFPPYGRSKGLPIAGASRQDLEFYANGARRSLGDPAKSRFHDKERALLALIEAELARQGGDEEPPMPESGPEAESEDAD
jgi:hypothetical protein